MRIHEREVRVEKASADLRRAVLDAVAELPGDLTDGEYVRIINGISYELIAGWAKYKIREERHGDTDTPGGWASDD